MPNRIYEELTAGEDLLDQDVVYISGDNTVMKTTGVLGTVIGVVDADVDEDGMARVALLGRATVACTGTIAAGNMVTSAADGKVAKFTTKNTIVSDGHDHTISSGSLEASEYNSAATSITTNPGEYGGGKIIGKALTGGTDKDIDIFIGLIA